MKDALTYDVTEYSEGSFQEGQVTAIQEVPLTIYLNGHEVVTLLCTGKHPEYLAVGFLKSDGLITDLMQLKDIHVEHFPERLKVFVQTSHDPLSVQPLERSITSGCGKGTNFEKNVETIAAVNVLARLAVSPQQILQLAASLHERSTLYRATRGCHNASLATPDRILIFREDIGRHNAIDKIFGQCLLENLPTDEHIIVTSGRISSEILLKVAKRTIPIIISKSAPTDLGVELADELGITIIGYVRGKRMNVYTHEWRVGIDEQK